jgi:hypothetical protein
MNISNLSNFSNGSNYTNGTSDAVVASTTIEWWKIVICAVLGILSGLFAGLNLGVMSLDTKYLELLTMGPFESK